MSAACLHPRHCLRIIGESDMCWCSRCGAIQALYGERKPVLFDPTGSELERVLTDRWVRPGSEEEQKT